MRVLVTDAANRVALAVVRALGRAGAEVAVVEQERFAARLPAAFRSRHVTRREVVPSLGDGDRFVEALARLSKEVDVLLPVSTNVLFACAARREAFAARVPVAPLDTIRRANDKSRALAAARKAGVPIPVTYAPEDDDELEEGIARIRLPAVVKLRDDEGTVLEPGRRYAVCRTADEIRRAYRRLHAAKPYPLLQELVRGDGYGVGVLAEAGQVLAAVAHRRVREYPVTGGPSAFCETVRDERLLAYAAAMIRELDWTGVAMVEFKKDDDYRLMEVNPRFWGALPLATAAGVNFPDLLCRRALGLKTAAPPDYPAGIRLRFLPLELAAVWSALSDPQRRWPYVTGFLKDLFDPSVRDGILDWGDLEASIQYLAGRMP